MYVQYFRCGKMRTILRNWTRPSWTLLAWPDPPGRPRETFHIVLKNIRTLHSFVWDEAEHYLFSLNKKKVICPCRKHQWLMANPRSLRAWGLDWNWIVFLIIPLISNAKSSRSSFAIIFHVFSQEAAGLYCKHLFSCNLYFWFLDNHLNWHYSGDSNSLLNIEALSQMQNVTRHHFFSLFDNFLLPQ